MKFKMNLKKLWFLPILIVFLIFAYFDDKRQSNNFINDCNYFDSSIINTKIKMCKESKYTLLKLENGIEYYVPIRGKYIQNVYYSFYSLVSEGDSIYKDKYSTEIKIIKMNKEVLIFEFLKR